MDNAGRGQCLDSASLSESISPTSPQPRQTQTPKHIVSSKETFQDIELRSELAHCRAEREKELVAQEADDLQYVNAWSPVVNCTKSEGGEKWVEAFQTRFLALCEYFRAKELNVVLDHVGAADSPEKWALDLFSFTFGEKSEDAKNLLQKIYQGSKEVESGPIGALLFALSHLKQRIRKAAFEKRVHEINSAWDRLFSWGSPIELGRATIGPDGSAEGWVEKYLTDWIGAIVGLASALKKHHYLYVIAEPWEGLPEHKVLAWHDARQVLHTAATNSQEAIRLLKECVKVPGRALRMSDCLKQGLSKPVWKAFYAELARYDPAASDDSCLPSPNGNRLTDKQPRRENDRPNPSPSATDDTKARPEKMPDRGDGQAQEYVKGLGELRIPVGATWRDVDIRFIDNQTVSVSAGGNRERFNYSDFGMTTKRSKRPDAQWELLLAFAKLDGRLQRRDREFPKGFQKRKERLVQILKAAFPIEGQPIAIIPGKGWKTVFRITDQVDRPYRHVDQD